MRNYHSGKRGRPSIAETYFNMPGEEIMFNKISGGLSKRARANRVYMRIGYNIVAEAATAYPELKPLLPPTYKEVTDGEYHKVSPCSGILEQLGRMKQQNNFNNSDVLTVAGAAAEALARGVSSKTIQAEIRRIRAVGTID